MNTKQIYKRSKTFFQFEFKKNISEKNKEA